MAWSRSQQITLHRAAALAGWTDKQRHLAMRWARCPKDAKKDRPSITHPSNNQKQFELVMSIAEGHAKQQHGHLPGEFPRSGSGDPWEDVARKDLEQSRHKAKEIWGEARQRLPEVFAQGGLDGFVQRMTENHIPELAFEDRPETIDDIFDPATLYRIFEGLKAWVGREFLKRDMTPKSFIIPAAERRRLGGRAQVAGVA